METKETGKSIIIQGASEHNLQSVDVEIPHNKLVVVTGVSGSGKSSLVFDTLYREGERRYVESFSSYARQFMGKMARPAVNHIEGLSPAIAVDQKTVTRSPRSTVGTLSELYDYLRLLFARLGEAPNNIKPERRLFSFNTPHGWCPACKGLGVQDRIDVGKLVEDPSKTLRQGALTITTPSGYIIYSQVTMEVLNSVCNAHGFNVDIPWRDMTEEQKKIVLDGSDIIKIPYGKHPLESRMKWSGITAKPREEGYYKGILPVMENILRVDRNKNILRFARTEQCGECSGARLRPEALAVTFKGKNIAEMAGYTVESILEFFGWLEFTNTEAAAGEPLREFFIKRCGLLMELGLGYLTLDRESSSLSGGEAQRIRLSTQVDSGLRGILYVLDEPSIGLHHRDNLRMTALLKKLRDNGNTVVVVEHDEDIMREADMIIDMGPGAGVHGGEVLFQGSIDALLADSSLDKSLTRKFLLKDTVDFHREELRKDTKESELLEVLGAREHNLKSIDAVFRLGALNVVSGVSGAGKSTLVHDILANALKQTIHRFNKAKKVPGTKNEHLNNGKFKEIKGIEFIDKVIEIDQSPIGRTPRSNPATYTKLFDHIRDLFANHGEAKKRKWSKGRFSFNVKGGRCETCEGAGLQQIGMHFLGSVDVVCETCGGKRFNDETLEIYIEGKINGKTCSKNIFDILEMPVEEAAVFFEDHPKISRFLEAMLKLGLGYIALGQSATTLSGGEAQRVKLASELCRPATGNTLYILDEPTTGLHAADIEILLKSLNGLTEKGNTVIVVEHHPDVLMAAGHIIDLGPESGEKGGEVIATGSPKEISQCSYSHTGKLLSTMLNKPTIIKSFSGGQGGRQQAAGPSYTANQRTILEPAFQTNRIHVPRGGRRRQQPIELRGVCTHNLRAVDVDIPVGLLTVVTGVSGSGKSSLAFDTLFAEGQQRFLSHLSAYARQMMGVSGGRADVSSVSGLMPTVAISQKTAARNPRSTVGTMTEIYDYYRLIFARVGIASCPGGHGVLRNGFCGDCGFRGPEVLFARMFSFNHHQGACPACNGMGTVTSCDPAKLVTDGTLSLLGGAMDGTKTGKFYGDWYGQYTAILKTVGDVEGIDFSVPWDGLDERARTIAMWGTGDKTYNVTWQFKRKNREGEHRFETDWKGLVYYVNEEYERKHADRRGQAMLPLMSDALCGECGGARLKPEFLSVRFRDLNIAELSGKTVADSIAFFRSVEEEAVRTGGAWGRVTAEARREVTRRLEFLRDVGLDYLSLDRGSSTLSGGEAQRIRLAGQLGAGLTGVAYVLDEPTIGLHGRDTERLTGVIKNLRDIGNTVIVVEHDRDVMVEADHIIEMGPGGGRNGGSIVAQGSLDDIKNNMTSPTGVYLKDKNGIRPQAARRVLNGALTGALTIKGACANNLKGMDIRVPLGGIIGITGVSGSGKSSLAFDVIGASAKLGRASGCGEISGLDNFGAVIAMDQGGIGSSPASTPATYTGIFDLIRDCFAAVELAKQRKYKKNRFSFNVKGGRCEACQGNGKKKIPMDFLADVWTSCDECGGKRYNKETLEIVINGKTIADVLEMTVSEALAFFTTHGPVRVREGLEVLEEIGLGYICLGQAANTLSGGEAQRLKLAAELLKGKKKKNTRNLYLLDEPTTGLHFRDIERLLGLFHRLADEGHTLLVVEHHPDVIRHADWLIDLGPEGGDRGGEIVAEGTPETVALCRESYTTQYCLA